MPLSKAVALTTLLGFVLSAAAATSPMALLTTPSDDGVIATEQMPRATLNYLEIHQRAYQTTVVLRLQNGSDPTAFMLNNPDRLIIDLPSAAVSMAMPKQIQDNGLIQHIRFGKGPMGQNNVRLVFDLAKSCSYALLVDDDPKTQQQTLTVILNTTATTTLKPEAITEPVDLDHLHVKPLTPAHSLDKVIEQNADKPIKANKATLIHSSQARSIVIVIDPGHGGKDSGAIGTHNLQEKTVVLAISKRLELLINQQLGMSAKLTRQGDYFIGLRERLHLARAYKADLFMAIHADAFTNDTAAGASVFALSQHGASSEAARWLAERENISEFAGLPFKTTNYQLKSMLLDMSQTATNQDSLSFGTSLLRRLTTITPLHARAVEQAGFMVLKSPDTPSVLVETGFISNPTEAALLNDANFQQKLATALMQGIVSYCQQNPPPDTYFEMQFKKPN